MNPEASAGAVPSASAASRERTKQLFASFPTGVAVLAAQDAQGRWAMPMSTFTVGISLDPPLVSAAFTRSSRTWPHLRSAARIGVSILGEDQHAVLRRLGGADRAARWEGLEPIVLEGSALVLPGAAAWMLTSLEAVHPAGDHELALLRVLDHGLHAAQRPMIYHRSGLYGRGADLEGPASGS
ncbi:flavin reductase family protein [Brachybacterium phenoliresistens]|uniref:flavin reductase family protein n=1 Tax=Brachybacterium phenoliresistens TaxID=396014 RepID=UPI0031DD947D